MARAATPEEGVDFDLRARGVTQRIGGTEKGHSNALLVLDRNANGQIDDGKELFGSVTDQPGLRHRNGFAALAVFDTHLDNVIDAAYPVYSSLRLWTDVNHNARVDSGEPRALNDANVVSISIAYKPSNRRDGNGNRYRYRAEVKLRLEDHVVTTCAWDEFLAMK